MPIAFTKPWDFTTRTCHVEQADSVLCEMFRVKASNCMRCNKPITSFVGCYHCDECCALWENKRKAKRSLRTFEASDRTKEDRNAYAMARAWRPMTTNIYLQGDVGTGKSFLTECVMHKCRKMELTTLTLTALDFCKLFGYKADKESHEYLINADVLAIDDVDKAPWFGTTLYELWQMLNIRRARCKSTVFSTNFDENTLLKYFQEFVPKNLSLPEAVMDRMRPVMNIRMTGSSLRRYEKTLQQANQGRVAKW